MSGKHGPVPLEKYLNIHQSAMASHLKLGFVIDDGVQFDVVRSHAVYQLAGRIQCAGQLTLDVRKVLEVTGREGRVQFVQTVEYTYHAQLGKVREVFRYCGPHEEGHNDEHHVHRFDVLGSGKQLADSPTFLIHEEERPTLGEVIEELHRWHDTHGDDAARLLASFD